MRWPNRHPHVLTPGMRRAQAAMAGFLPLIAWGRFRRVPVDAKARGFHTFACADGEQAAVYLLRRGHRLGDGRVDQAFRTAARVSVPMPSGRYDVVSWNPVAGREVTRGEYVATDGTMRFTDAGVPGDRAYAVRRCG